MKYLLDTCCISDFLKSDFHTVNHLKKTPPFEITVSSITLMELEYGLLHNPDRAKKLKPLIQAFISNIIVLDYTEKDANHSAVIRALMRKLGTPIGNYDALIASAALNHQLILVTSNEKEFRRIPDLQLENWRQ